MTATRHAPQSEWDDPDWRRYAECLSTDPELFFPLGDDPKTRTKAGREQVAEAKLVCMRCEVRATCLDYAITTGQDMGIWGGLDEDERRALKRKQDRQARALARQGVAS